MARVTEVFDESFDYVRSPEYMMPVVIFCIGFGLSSFALQALQVGGFKLWQPFLLLGGLGFTVWSFTQFYVLYLGESF